MLEKKDGQLDEECKRIKELEQSESELKLKLAKLAAQQASEQGKVEVDSSDDDKTDLENAKPAPEASVKAPPVASKPVKTDSSAPTGNTKTPGKKPTKKKQPF